MIVLGAEALAYAEAGQYDAAEKVFADALALDPTLSGALYNLACLRSRQGRLAEAADFLEKAWKTGDRDVTQLRRDPWLEALSKSGRPDKFLAKNPRGRGCPTG